MRDRGPDAPGRPGRATGPRPAATRSAASWPKRDDTTAVFVANDQMAIGVLHAFAEAGLRVPDDVSVVGFDDIPEAGYLNPALTTVRQDFQAVGQRAIDLVTATLDGSTTERAAASPRTDHPRQHGTSTEESP